MNEMDLILTCCFVFLSGFIHETACVYWVHNSEKGKALKAAFWSSIAATTTIIGVGQSIKLWYVAIWYILGYALGTFMAVSKKKY